MKYPNVTLGRVEAVWNKLGGEDGVDRFLRGELVLTAPTPPAFAVWKTVKLGTGLKTAENFRHAIKNAGIGIGDWGNDILDKSAFTASEQECEVDLVNVSVHELGFKDGAYRRDIIVKAQSLGLQLCLAEVGPQLRLQYPDQPEGECLLVGMEPITDSGGCPRVFSVQRGGDERWLGGHDGYFWSGASRFLFVCPRK